MFKLFETKKTYIIFSVIILAGILYRVLFYSYGRPFWNDECALANNVINFNIVNCFKPLAFSQAAPPFFLVISGLFSKMMPSIELSLRFFPLIASVLSIFAFYFVSKKVLNKKSAIVCALLLFCFNYRLIYYAQEFKQYSSDVLIFLSILASYFYLDIEKLNTKKLVLAGFVYAVSVWFSFASLFALFTVFCLFIFKNIKSYKKLIPLILPVVASFVCFYVFEHHLAINKFLLEYWQNGFINQDFSNFGQIFMNYFAYSFNSIIIMLFFLIGLALKLFNFKNEKSLILLIPIALAVVLSYFKIYPLESRVSLYLIPVCILFAVQILEYMNFKKKLANYIFYSLIIFILGFPVVINSTYKIVCKDFEKEDIVTTLTQADKMIKAGDVLYIPDGSEITYNFYKNKFNFKNVMVEKQRINDTREYLKSLDKLPKGKTYYYVFCHFPDKQQRLQAVYLWAKGKNGFKIYADKYFNALVVFKQP